MIFNMTYTIFRKLTEKGRRENGIEEWISRNMDAKMDIEMGRMENGTLGWEVGAWPSSMACYNIQLVFYVIDLHLYIIQTAMFSQIVSLIYLG